MKNNYSIAERNRIVEEYLPLIDKVIRRNGALMKAAKLDYDDVYQDLAVRLIRCVETFDPDKGTLRTHIYSQLQYELMNCKTPRKLTGIVGAPADFRQCNILPLDAMNGTAILHKGGDFMSAIVLASTKEMPYEDWLEYRKLGIGGSDASIVCGINRYKSPVELWLDKTGQLPYQEAGEAAYWGTLLEGLVRDEFTKRTGIEVTQPHQLLRSDEYPFMLANLDGICEDADHGPCIFEAKTASAFKSGAWDNAIPDEYMLQVQHYMAVTGYRGTYIAVLIGGNTFKWRFIERDDELIQMLISLEYDFWNHVQAMTPPPLDGSDAAAQFLATKFPNSAAKSQIALPDSALELLHQYDDASNQLDTITAQKKEAENRLKQMLGEYEIGTVGNWVITWKNISQERLDIKTLKAEHPTLYKKYASKTSYRRFSVKEKAAE